MQIAKISIRNFRGIAELDWNTCAGICCLIGPGDAGKSTILDAVEAALSSRWFSFSESDFHRCNTSSPLEVEVTVHELSKALKSDERFGLYIRGLATDGTINDEPEDGDEPALTVRLSVDATMEPVWELVCDRASNPRTLSNRDRALFGLVRLAGEDARHLTWGQGSILSKLTGDSDEVAQQLAAAYRLARDSANLGSIKALADTAIDAETRAKNLGAYVEATYAPGLELVRGGFSAGSIALHDGEVPLRLAGLGTRRLATLAIQQAAIAEGAIVLVDEIEHGLEPHRIVNSIAQLKAGHVASHMAGKAQGQILMTTHSDVALGEIDQASLFVVRRNQQSKSVDVLSPDDAAEFWKVIKNTPRALFAKRILVCEGVTEVGLINGMRNAMAISHESIPIEQLGAAIVSGDGTTAPQLALALANLGYETALYRDSDCALSKEHLSALPEAGVAVFEYGGAISTETALFLSGSEVSVQQLIDFARQEKGPSVNADITRSLGAVTPEVLAHPFCEWDLRCGATDAEMRLALAGVALQMKWFKKLLAGKEIAPIAWAVVEESPDSVFANTIRDIEAWLYA